MTPQAHGARAELASTLARDRKALRGLLWTEWRRHRLGIIFGLGSIAIAMLPMGAAEPIAGRTILLLFTCMAAGCGLGFGRAEWLRGEEEFGLSLPPTRRERYIVRATLALGIVLAVYAIGTVTALWGLSEWLFSGTDLSARFDRQFPHGAPSEPGWLAFVFTAPLALFAETFTVSLATERRGDLRGLLEGALVVLLGLLIVWADRALLGSAAGWIVAPVFLGFAAVRLRIGLAQYERKDAVLTVQANAEPNRLVLILLAVLTGLVVLGVALERAASAH